MYLITSFIYLFHYAMQIITANQEIKNADFNTLLSQSAQTLLYFYPKDNTPWCSLEARDFAQHAETFAQHGIQIIGVSKDSAKSHCNFIQKQGLTFSLIADEALELHKQFGARGEKKNYGKIFEGTIRSTFLLDQQGNILKARRNVKATGHVERLMKELEIGQEKNQ